MINDDTDFEGPETFTFSIDPLQADAAVIVGDPSSANITITDDEDGKIYTTL